MAKRNEAIQELEKRIAKLELEVGRAEAVTACTNLMNKYQIYSGRMPVQQTPLFALNTPDVSVEMLEGIYDKPEGVIRWRMQAPAYGKIPKPVGGPIQGGAIGHSMTTPIIEVAKDGKTAKGLWLMFGSEAARRGPDDQILSVDWGSAQFAMDFIKEDGEWKIWKYTSTGLIFSPSDKGWHVDNQKILNERVDRKIEPGEGPDRPVSPSCAWMWGPDEYFHDIPLVPLPYETWDDSLACVPVPGKKRETEEFNGEESS